MRKSDDEVMGVGGGWWRWAGWGLAGCWELVRNRGSVAGYKSQVAEECVAEECAHEHLHARANAAQRTRTCSRLTKALGGRIGHAALLLPARVAVVAVVVGVAVAVLLREVCIPPRIELWIACGGVV